MKTRAFILILVAVLFNSCIVKSLNPFFTEDSISYTNAIVGNWIDHNGSQWNVKPLEPIFAKSIDIKEKKGNINFEGTVTVTTDENNADDTDLTLIKQNGYLISYTKKEKKATFVAIPFKIENQYFLDFIPFMDFDLDINKLLQQHLIVTHSLAKLDINDKSITMSWLSEENVKNLFEANKLRLKHEKVGIEEDFLLTATTEELHGFVKKYMNSNIEDKWKKSDSFTLTKSDAKP